MAWKEGYFRFDKEDFRFIVAQLERWYDVDFIYPSTMSTWEFAGAIPRNTTLKQVLKMLELSGSIKYNKEGRKKDYGRSERLNTSVSLNKNAGSAPTPPVSKKADLKIHLQMNTIFSPQKTTICN